jgi:dGTPase
VPAPPRLTPPTAEQLAKLDERRHAEPAPSVRSDAQRDRDRILYSSALLRLGHVTQVAAPEVGHTFHSRLTHSLKVAQVARGLAQRLRQELQGGKLEEHSSRLVAALDEDATEAAALAHDLGHPPFGHLAEQVLQERTSKASFEGNAQSFRIVTRLSLRAPEIVGLNLTRRTLNGLLKYPWLHAEEPPIRAEKWGAYDADRAYFDWAREGIPTDTRTLEAELMDWADDITYAVHDMDDFYRAGLIPIDRLTGDPLERASFERYLHERHGQDGERYARAADRLFDAVLTSVRTRFAGLADERMNLRVVSSALISRYIAAPTLADQSEHAVFEIPVSMRDEVTVLKDLTWCYIIERPSLAVIQEGHRRIVHSLYDMYSTALEKGDRALLPPAFRERAEDAHNPAERERVVIDLIAGMTEASATEIYKQRLGVAQGSLIAHATGPG